MDLGVPEASGSGNVEAAYRQNHEEIRRRQSVTQSHSENQNPKFFEHTEEVPFKFDAQTHFVWSASHEGMAPLARDPKHPAVRIYGLFPSHAEAVEHAKVVAGLDPTCSLMVSPTHEWAMVPRTPERISAEHIERVLEAYKAERKRSAAEFKENVAKQRGGTGLRKKEEKEERIEEAAAPRRLGRDAEVRDQSVVAVSFVTDPTQAVGEPIFRVYAAFENAAAADGWARCAGDNVTDFDIDIVSTCVWLFPTLITSEAIAKEVYRSKELESIMANQKKQPLMVENFRKWREESESEA